MGVECRFKSRWPSGVGPRPGLGGGPKYRQGQHRGTLLEDSVQRSWTATFFRIFVFFLYPEKYGGSKTVLKSEIGLVDHIQKK